MAGHFITTTISDPFGSSPASSVVASVAASAVPTAAGNSAAISTDTEYSEKRTMCPFCYTKQMLKRGHPCPNAECYSNRRGIPLPPEVFTHELFPVVIVGASSSGKSHFLATLKHRLVNEGFWGDGEENGYWKWAFIEYSNPANADDASVDNPFITYETTLYQRHQTLDSTRRDDEHPPLLLSVDYLNPIKRVFNEPLFFKKSLLVAITDTAGEHAQGGLIGSFEKNYPVLKKLAKGIIVMLDPKEISGNATETANSIISFFKRGRRRSKTPIALCVSKIDELAKKDEAVPQNWLDERFNTDLSVPGCLALPDIENNSSDILEWMRKTNLRATADDLESSFRYHACFVTSALGVEPFQLDVHGMPVNISSTGALSLKNDFPQPLRVLDPFLWILWQHGKLGAVSVITI